MALHTLIGANGTIANALIPVLQANQQTIRLVSRKPKAVTGAQTVAASALNRDELMKAVAGSEVVYLLIGIDYKADVWQRDWPLIMQNTIAACQAANAKLIFFDDVYMYGRVKGPITEETPYRPSSRKGKVRAGVATMLQQAMQAGQVRASIARAVDFYGPGVSDKSAPGIYVFSNLKKGNRAQWPINANVPRSFNYTPDAAQALYLLATREEALGQVWHLPTPQPALTGREFVELSARAMNTSNKLFVLPKWMLKAIGWFNPFMKEAYEMNYQDEFAFQFDSSKFELAFNYRPTSYEEGIKVTAAWFQDR
ncbi:NAD-dependent epimerase/dehydratase family protein [Spirosoma foliorum]|uniref:NAD-dependent epimerase/dehydratase family protein n=1 Tax=Spirosoma foliorum TaxID=2710596 RepID=A0A7G5H1J1_9BACT|nr:NAD-dependent epimerase/dehydratase family protein [Spirosoma foliorum]QMW04983.1 NAD-dependent epimerase/dehydratase family protein [Spirosoma foliorum]